MNFNVGDKYKFDNDSDIYTIEYIDPTHITWSSEDGFVGSNDYSIDRFIQVLEFGSARLVSEPLKPYRTLKKFTL